MNSTQIEWTPELIREQRRRNEQRAAKMRTSVEIRLTAKEVRLKLREEEKIAHQQSLMQANRLQKQLERQAQIETKLEQMLPDPADARPMPVVKRASGKTQKPDKRKRSYKKSKPQRKKVLAPSPRPQVIQIQPVLAPFDRMVKRAVPRKWARNLSEVIKEAGYVYLIEHRGLHKIGMTINVPSRMRSLQKHWQMESYRIVHVITSDDMIYLEAALHRRFEAKCVHAEWYSLLPADVKWICGLGETVNGFDVLLIAS